MVECWNLKPILTDLKLPETVEVCQVCKGHGEYPQNYNAGCGGGMYKSIGTCEYCQGMLFQYKGTLRGGVPKSVLYQIIHTNRDLILAKPQDYPKQWLNELEDTNVQST